MSKISESVLSFEQASPRVVADLQSLDFEIEYIREDVEIRYTDEELDEAYKLIMGSLVVSDDFTSLIGEEICRVQTLFFDNVLVFLFPSERYQAVFASFDYDAEFPVNEFVQHVTEIAPTE
jgi:hypothetical protein